MQSTRVSRLSTLGEAATQGGLLHAGPGGKGGPAELPHGRAVADQHRTVRQRLHPSSLPASPYPAPSTGTLRTRETLNNQHPPALSGSRSA
eukprot:15504-Prorocentrum_minimum.AAC.4